MVTVASAVAPADIASGSGDPKDSFTLSPSSSTLSEAAVKVMVLEVSPALNVTLAGTPL